MSCSYFIDVKLLSLFLQLTDFVGKVEIDKPKINYLKYQPKEPDFEYDGKNKKQKYHIFCLILFLNK